MSVEFWKAIFDWCSVVLVGLTFIAGAGALITGKVLSNRQDAALKRIELDLAAANERAAQADLRRVELENRIALIFGPRHLTPEQATRISGKLAGLRSVKVDVFVMAVGNPYTAGDFEDSESIARAVVRTLRAAPAYMDAEGWLLENCQGSGASNLVVSVKLPANDVDRTIATRLIKALQPEIGTYPELSDHSAFCTKFSDLDRSNPNKRGHDATISITIGRKINPLLTHEMLDSDDEQKQPSK
jgi:hypothetical protein